MHCIKKAEGNGEDYPPSTEEDTPHHKQGDTRWLHPELQLIVSLKLWKKISTL